MKGPEKDAAMDAFKNGGVDLLVATTVIEVGVDVPQATVLVSEHAERFGLAQLHQLRGRIGRGDTELTRLRLYGAPLTEAGRRPEERRAGRERTRSGRRRWPPDHNKKNQYT